MAGGEIGSAQYFQALAARTVPDVRMNPLLLKPEGEMQSQVVLMGRVDAALSRMPWRGRSASVWPQVSQALDELRAENDVVVIEGAGSPAEINLKADDIVNMRAALHADAACLLVTDIDRGGAFAHLYGTWALLPPEERALLRGFVLNRFRGDASLLAPGPEDLQALTGVPTVATIPMWRGHGLPEEDGVFDEGAAAAAATGVVHTTIAVIAGPHISNLDEFQPLKNVPGVRLVWARSPAALVGADWVVLPGSKRTPGDLAWVRKLGLDRAIAEHAARGGRVLGICGGLQMLGEALIDPFGLESSASDDLSASGSAARAAMFESTGPGLGLLPLVTVFDREKTVRACNDIRFGTLAAPWNALSGLAVRGYEIHHGRTALHSAMVAAGDSASEVLPGGLGWQGARPNVLGIYVHGLFENAAVLQALFGAAAPTLDTVFDGLARCVEAHFQDGVLEGLLRPA